jgi:hypothetical protein
MCESGGNYAIATGNGFYGAYQFDAGTWASLGFGGLPNQAAPWVQDEAVAKLWRMRGWAPWPGCSPRHGRLVSQTRPFVNNPTRAARKPGARGTMAR